MSHFVDYSARPDQTVLELFHIYKFLFVLSIFLILLVNVYEMLKDTVGEI